MIFRKAQPDDIPELVRLRVEFLNEVNGREGPPQGFEEALTQYLAAAMAEGSFDAWLAIEDGRIAATSGVCYQTIAPNYSNPSGRSAYVLNMYTLPGFRRRGLATELLSRIIEDARRRGCVKVSLHATQEGRMVYGLLGFKTTDDEMVLRLG